MPVVPVNSENVLICDFRYIRPGVVGVRSHIGHWFIELTFLSIQLDSFPNFLRHWPGRFHPQVKVRSENLMP